MAQVKPTGQTKKAETPAAKTPNGTKQTDKDIKKEPENKKTKVYLLHANQGQADKLARPDVQVLIGNVKLRHDSMYMFCDSALI